MREKKVNEVFDFYTSIDLLPLLKFIDEENIEFETLLNTTEKDEIFTSTSSQI